MVKGKMLLKVMNIAVLSVSDIDAELVTTTWRLVSWLDFVWHKTNCDPEI